MQLPGHVIASDQHVLLDILPPLKRGEGGGGGVGGGAKLSREERRSRQQQQSWVIVEGHGERGGEGETATDPLKNYKLMVYTAQPRAPEQRSERIKFSDDRENSNVVLCKISDNELGAIKSIL